jgi:predicted RNA-binding Zn ribbon-like protein
MSETKPGRRRPPAFELIAGNLCLDFINTLDNRPSAQPKDLLAEYTDLVRFGEDTGFLDVSDANYMFERSHPASGDMQEALRRAIAMREAMYGVFSAIVAKRSVPRNSLGILNAYIQDAAAQARLVEVSPDSRRFEWRFDHLTSPGGLLWPIARAAADLLASDQLAMVRTCSSPTCQWFFLDTSKNHHRRWCSMKSCGNRAKVRRFYAKKRTA